MADTTSSNVTSKLSMRNFGGAWLAIVLVILSVAIFVPTDLGYVLKFTAQNIIHTGIFITFAVLLVAYLRASEAETLVASAFQGNQIRMVILASMVGGLLPFCSCEVIPFVAALLALGTPLAAVMAFWLASPIMDPPMFRVIVKSGV